MTANDEKLRQLILYISERCELDVTFGKTKLYKLLFYSDFSAYTATQQPITGQDYRKWPRGPVPVRAEGMLAEMEANGLLVMVERTHFGKTQLKPIARKEPNLNHFTATEIATVDEVISSHWGRSARDISDLSHDFVGWKAARNNEVIPYETALVEVHEWTEEDEDYAKKLLAAGR